MILVVDDSEIIVDWLRIVIQGAGYYYDAASDATIALYKAERLSYALMLIDIGLPDYPGDVLAERIKQIPGPYGTIPMVAITGGEPLPPERRQFFLDVMHKPFLPHQLREAIQKYARPPVKDLHMARAAAADGV